MWVIHWDALENIFWSEENFLWILQNMWNFEEIGNFEFNKKEGYVLQNTVDEVNCRVLLLKKEKGYNIETFYPNFNSGWKVLININEVREDENGIEAYIIGEIITDHEIKRDILFFALDYILNKEKYFVWNIIPVALLATPVVFDVAKEYYEVDYDEEMLNKLWIDPQYDENGNIKPTRFYNTYLTYVIPTEKSEIVFEFMASFDTIETLQLENTGVQKTIIEMNLWWENWENMLHIPFYFNMKKYSHVDFGKWKIQWFLEFHGFLIPEEDLSDE